MDDVLLLPCRLGAIRSHSVWPWVRDYVVVACKAVFVVFFFDFIGGVRSPPTALLGSGGCGTVASSSCSTACLSHPVGCVGNSGRALRRDGVLFDVVAGLGGAQAKLAFRSAAADVGPLGRRAEARGDGARSFETVPKVLLLELYGGLGDA